MMDNLIGIATPACGFCGQSGLAVLTEDEFRRYQAWQRREMPVQDAFPHWAPAQREVLITGTHPACWEAAFGGL